MSYQWELDPASMNDPQAVTRFWREQALASEDNKSFFEDLVRGMAARMPELDDLIKKYLKNWKVDRLEKVDLALLRVAIYEMLFYTGKDPADVAVVINEAIEISKKFGTPKSASFINGVLDNVARDRGLVKPPQKT